MTDCWILNSALRGGLRNRSILATNVWQREIFSPFITFTLLRISLYQRFLSLFSLFLHLSRLPLDHTCPKCSLCKLRPISSEQARLRRKQETDSVSWCKCAPAVSNINGLSGQTIFIHFSCCLILIMEWVTRDVTWIVELRSQNLPI